MAQFKIDRAKNRMRFQDIMDECSGFQNVQEIDSFKEVHNDDFTSPEPEKYIPEKPEFYHQGANPPREETNNPSKTAKQQRFMGIARGVQKGTVSSKYSPAATKAAHSMTPSQVREFASHRSKKHK